MMPSAGAGIRAEQLATIERLAHERFTDGRVERLLSAAEREGEGLDPASDDGALLRVARRDLDKAQRVPSDLAAEMARAAAIGQEAWVKARAESDFAAFLPHLERGLELRARYIACFEGLGYEDPYDVLLDDFEQGMTSAEVTVLFERLREGLVPLIAGIAAHAGAVDAAPLHGDFPLERQRELVRRVLEPLGFTPERWRMDDTVHPFASSSGNSDLRITNRYDPDFLGSALYAGIHEMGHSLYEAGVADELMRTPLGGGVSLGVHESQSRLWENFVGRSRPFSRYLAPLVAAEFPQSGAGQDPEALYRAVNRVEPSLIRVEADEATYCLHVILRFELERDLVGGRLAPRDLPAAWNEKMVAYLGIEPPDDAHGVLQDVHWSAGLIGYFPTYALGTILAGQLWERARADLAGLEEGFERGEFASLREWLREKVHRHGRKFTPKETVERAVGGPLDVEPLLAYLNEKYGELYDLGG
jgi:carboxypeptidase Taq